MLSGKVHPHLGHEQWVLAVSLQGWMPAVQQERLDPVNITPVEVVHRKNKQPLPALPWDSAGQRSILSGQDIGPRAGPAGLIT
ncbi:unnamed protein product [Arctogadus glacialis]